MVEAPGDVVEEREENVLILLDVSSSMNHDDKGIYQAPDSPDHPASSIRKARSVCVEIAILSFKGGCAHVSVVPWHNSVKKPIKLSRSSYCVVSDGGEREDLLSDDVLRVQLTAALGEKAFVAGGATNVEAVLNFCQEGILVGAKKAPGRLSVWFITDGEPTMANVKKGEAEYIPTSKQHAQYAYFNVRDAQDQLTQYERHLCTELTKSAASIRDLQTEVAYHFCVFGDALPAFMLALATASGGVCHPVRKDLETLISEFKGSAVSSVLALSVCTAAGEASLRASVVEGGVIYARGVLQPSQHADARRAMRVELKLDKKRPPLLLDSVERLQLDAQSCADIAALLSLESAIAQALDECKAGAGIEAALARASNTLKDIKRLRMELLGKLVRKLRYPLLKAYLESYMDTLMASEAALERLLAQYFLNNEAKDVSALASKVDLLSAKDKEALAAGAKSLQHGLGGFVAKRYDRQVAKIISTKGAWARKMLARSCQLHKTRTNKKDEPNSETLLSLFIFEGSSAVTDNRRLWLEKTGLKSAAWGAMLWVEKCYHEVVTNELQCTVAVWTDSKKTVCVYTGEKIPFHSIYCKGVVDQAFVRVRTSDLSRAEKDFLDPLSFSSFLELIEEQQTLPACVYNISETQVRVFASSFFFSLFVENRSPSPSTLPLKYCH